MCQFLTPFSAATFRGITALLKPDGGEETQRKTNHDTDKNDDDEATPLGLVSPFRRRRPSKSPALASTVARRKLFGTPPSPRKSSPRRAAGTRVGSLVEGSSRVADGGSRRAVRLVLCSDDTRVNDEEVQ